MDTSVARALFAQARVARLATVTDAGDPHLVPVCFALVGDDIVSAVDAKPKSTAALRRLANVAAHARVTLLADHYDDTDWTRLWWVRVDGDARVAERDDEAIRALTRKYAQYRDRQPRGSILRIAPVHWTGWAYDPAVSLPTPPTGRSE